MSLNIGHEYHVDDDPFCARSSFCPPEHLCRKHRCCVTTKSESGVGARPPDPFCCSARTWLLASSSWMAARSKGARSVPPELGNLGDKSDDARSIRTLTSSTWLLEGRVFGAVGGCHCRVSSSRCIYGYACLWTRTRKRFDTHRPRRLHPNRSITLRACCTSIARSNSVH